MSHILTAAGHLQRKGNARELMNRMGIAGAHVRNAAQET